jgi:hypothetical protein
LRLTLETCRTKGCEYGKDYSEEEAPYQIAKTRWFKYTIGHIEEEIYVRNSDITITSVSNQKQTTKVGNTVAIDWNIQGVEKNEDLLVCLAMQSDGENDGAQFVRVAMNEDEDVCIEAENGRMVIDVYLTPVLFEAVNYRPVIWITEEDNGNDRDQTFKVKRTGKWILLRQ